MKKTIIEFFKPVLTEEVVAQLAESYVDMSELRSLLVHRIYDFYVKHQHKAPLLQTSYVFGLSPKQIHRILFGR